MYVNFFLYCYAQYIHNILSYCFFLQTRSHSGEECNSFKAYALAHKGKATDPNLAYNPEDPPEVYSTPSVHKHLTDYTAMARQIHGPEFDPSTRDLEGEIVMRLGPGKQHGRYCMGNSTIDTASTPTLAQIRARSTSSSPAIRPRSQPQVAALQVSYVSSVVHSYFTFV